jgi:hypothetical protein
MLQTCKLRSVLQTCKADLLDSLLARLSIQEEAACQAPPVLPASISLSVCGLKLLVYEALSY